MKVYVVMCGDFDYVRPNSVWSAKEKAMERIQQLSVEHPDVYDERHPLAAPDEFEVDVP